MSSPEDSFATPRVAAGALFLDAEGRVLLVHPTYKDTWDIPGGYVERGESPAAACQREILEELGIDRAPARLAAVDWAPHELKETSCYSSSTAVRWAQTKIASSSTAKS